MMEEWSQIKSWVLVQDSATAYACRREWMKINNSVGVGFGLTTFDLTLRRYQIIRGYGEV